MPIIFTNTCVSCVDIVKFVCRAVFDGILTKLEPQHFLYTLHYNMIMDITEFFNEPLEVLYVWRNL